LLDAVFVLLASLLAAAAGVCCFYISFLIFRGFALGIMDFMDGVIWNDDSKMEVREEGSAPGYQK